MRLWRTVLAVAICLVFGLAGAAAGQTVVDGEDEGFWRWALAEVKGGERLETVRGPAHVPGPPEAEVLLEEVIAGEQQRGAEAPGEARRRGPPDHARAADAGRGGPAFCRSGVGHPVHGRDWCRAMGFGLGPVPWTPVSLEDVILGSPDRTPRADGRLSAREIAEILGEEALEEILRATDVDARRVFLNGRWHEVEGTDSRILQIRSSEEPVAEVTDLTGDGRVDAAVVFRGGSR